MVLIPYFSHLLSRGTQSSRGDGEVHRREAKTFCLKLGLLYLKRCYAFQTVMQGHGRALHQWQNSQNEANILNPVVLTKLLGVSVLVEAGENSAERRKDGIVGGQGGAQRRLVG